MPTYVTLANFTDQGIRNIKDSPERLGAFKAMAEKVGVSIKSVHYTVGNYDIVTVVEGSDEAVTSVLLTLGSLGNIRTQTLRAFSVEEMKTIITIIRRDVRRDVASFILDGTLLLSFLYRQTGPGRSFDVTASPPS